MFANVHSFSSCLLLENRPFLAIVMAESSFETHDEDSPVTSTPVQESVYSLRKKKRLEHYLSGTVRNTSSVKVGLLSSVSSNESGISEEEVSGEESRPQSQERVTKCMRGCSLVLVNLTKTYRDVGRHCWTTIMYR